MFDIGITDKIVIEPNIKIKYFFKGEKINWIIEAEE